MAEVRTSCGGCKESVDAEPQNASHHFEIGRLLWKKEKKRIQREMKEKAVESFCCVPVFGHYYSQVTVDEQRASKCYLRAVNLNPKTSNRMKKLGEITKSFWAFRRLGYCWSSCHYHSWYIHHLHTVHKKKWSRGCAEPQQAIRGYPTWCRIFGSAIPAVFGMFTAAIKGVEQFRRALEMPCEYFWTFLAFLLHCLGLSKESGNYSSLWKLLGVFKIAFAKCLPWIEDRKNGENDQSCLKHPSNVGHGLVFCLLQSATHAYQRAFALVTMQANIYSDIANSIDLMDALMRKVAVTEKMSLGSLMLEGGNSEFWCNEQLSKKSFDQARSIGSYSCITLAGMSVVLLPGLNSCSNMTFINYGESLASEAYESCLRAVQLLPLPEFQIGSGSLHIFLVLGAINQAVQRAPYLPESHNLKVCHVRPAGRSAYDAEQVCDNLKTKVTTPANSIDLSLTEQHIWRRISQAWTHHSGAIGSRLDLQAGLLQALGSCSRVQKLASLWPHLCALDASSPLKSLLAKGLSKLSTAEIIDMAFLTLSARWFHPLAAGGESHINSRILSAQHHLKKALQVIALLTSPAVLLHWKPKLSFLHMWGLSVPLSKTIHPAAEPHGAVFAYPRHHAKARVEKYPPHLCLAGQAAAFFCFSPSAYKTGDHRGCIGPSHRGVELPVSCDGLSLPTCSCAVHMQPSTICRTSGEVPEVLAAGNRHEIGWILLKHLESRHRLRSSDEDGGIDVTSQRVLKGTSSLGRCGPAFDLVCAQSFVWDEDFLLAEQTLARACSLMSAESLPLLLSRERSPSAALCMELARRQAGPRFLSLAIRSLTRAQETSAAPLPVVSALLAQAVGSSAAKEKWAKNLQSDGFPGQQRRPPEVVLPDALLPEVHDAEPSRSRGSWVLRSIHMNPYSQRYWKALRKLMEG
ncbi:unnamed protein product [Spirodela intermedia]|uniref:Uncharacterized protein n=1 Tax=Spirodela intermedia TaxID=51605 RepID=A0A7I8JMB0_SPIIN|nr:unnamed protein product [Spirodela intermedia]CAA6670941.1 unnamed protein product [Spirodela intermedia]